MRKQNIAFAVGMIILLRVAIGWQFLYEGLWKINSLATAKPWTASGYLKNASGPMRPFFRAMTGDPDELKWLDYDSVSKKWDVWYERFSSHYRLNKNQRIRLYQMLNGFKDFRVNLKRLPKGVKFQGSLARVIRYDSEKKQLVVSGVFTHDARQPRLRMLPRERDALLKLAPGEDADSVAYRKAINYLFDEKASKRLSFKEKLAATVGGDPEYAGIVDPRHKGTIDYKQIGKIELYKKQLERYEQNLKNARQAFHYEHLNRQFQELQQLRAEVVGPPKALDKELKAAAKKLLSQQQLQLGPPSLPWDPIDWTNFFTIAGLTSLGLLLIAGLFTRFACFAGAGMLFSFYMVSPPWPGLPPTPGPEHSLFINKNLIEVIALIAIAGLPTGRWFGLDFFVDRWLNKDDEDDLEDTGRTATTIAAQEEITTSFEEDSTDEDAANAGEATPSEKTEGSTDS